MARPREFGEVEVLDAALQTFWSRGYEGTSIQNLVDATGIGRASLYGAFGDKRAIFEKVLEHYQARLRAAAGAVENDPSPLRGLERLLLGLLDVACPKTGPRGCLLLLAGTTTTEDDGARALLEKTMQHNTALFAGVIRSAQARGEVPTDRNPTAVARLLVILAQGLASAARAGWKHERLREVLAEALGQIGTPSGDPKGRRSRSLRS